jgi:Uri superfamily endonuclease
MMKDYIRPVLLSHLSSLKKIDQESNPAGCYQLFLKLSNDLWLKVGALGELFFPTGVYIYTGSHQKNVLKRVNRHLSLAKKVFWHIDYLTVDPAFEFIEVIFYFSENQECHLHRSYRAFTQASILFPGFGSTDCKNGCGSHLLFLKSEQQLNLSAWEKFYLDGKNHSDLLTVFNSK